MRLTYTITADAQQAERANAAVEAGLQRVEAQAKKTGETNAEWSKRFQADQDRRLRAIDAEGKARDEQARNESRRLSEQQKKTADFEGQVKSLGKAMLAAFAVDVSLGFVKSLAAAAGQIRDTSQALGLSTRTFQTFKFAVEDGGGTVNDLSQALSTMSKNLIAGPASTVEALRSLNLDIHELKRLAPDQAFLAIADAIRDNKNPMEQMQAALALFGRSGKDILPAIQQGFRETASEAETLGLVIGDDNLKALDLFEKRWVRAEMTIKAIISNLLGAVFQLNDAIANAVPAWLQNGIQRTMLSTPAGLAGALMENPQGLRDRLWNETFLGGAQNGPGMPNAPGSPGGLAAGSAFDTTRYSGLAIPPAVTLSTRSLTSARRELVRTTQDAIAADREYLRGLTATIGVNRDLQLDASHPFARTGIAGAITTAADSPFLPGSNPLMYAMMPGVYSGIRSDMPRPQPVAPVAGGFWNGRGGQMAAAGIGIAGSAAIGAMAGGDPYASMIGGAASTIGGAALAGTITSAAALGAATMGIGAAAVGVYMLAKHFTTVSKEVKQARVDIAEFQQELWKTANGAQMNEAAGQDWAATVIVVRDAYDRMGKSAAEAEADVLALWDDRNPERARAAMQKITDVMEDLRRILSEANMEMGTLLGQAAQLATRLPQSVLDQLQALVERGDLTDANAALVRQLQGASAIDYDQVRNRASALGLDPNALGGAMAQHQTTKTAQQYIDDIDLFQRSGIDMGTVLFGMREELSGLVQEAMRFNTELPANMQPWIKELQRAGYLVDENGEKLEDISGLNWGETLETSTQRLIDSIQDLIDTLNGPLQNAFNDIPSEVRTRLVVERDDLTDVLPEREHAQGLQYGGVVYAAQGFVPRGTDTVPAMLTPGEGVLSRRGMAMLGRLNSGAMGGGNDAQAIGRAIVAELERAGGLRPVVQMNSRIVSEELAPDFGEALEFQGIRGPAWRR